MFLSGFACVAASSNRETTNQAATITGIVIAALVWTVLVYGSGLLTGLLMMKTMRHGNSPTATQAQTPVYDEVLPKPKATFALQENAAYGSH